MVKIVLDKDWLYKKYWCENNSMEDIAFLLGCSRTTILRKLKKYNLPRRLPKSKIEKKIKFNISKEELYNLYVLEKKCGYDIGEIYGCQGTTIYNKLREYNIPIRSRHELMAGENNPMFGVPSPTLGKKCTLEEIEKNSSRQLKGKDHPRYKNPEDRRKNLTKQIKDCSEYKIWRRRVLFRDCFTCQICLKKCNKENKPDIDHIIPFWAIRDFFNIKNIDDAIKCEKLWDINNGRVLCRPCHKKTDTWGIYPKERINEYFK